jgi:hypothetical protein
LYIWNGVSAANVKKLWDLPSPEKKALNSRVRAPNAMILEYHWQQLSPGDKYDNLMDRHIVPDLQKALNWETLRKHTACLKTATDSVTISLHDWCAETFISNLIRAYCGRKIHEINPNLLKANLVWENTSWKFLYQLPGIFSRDMNSARNEFNQTLQAYFELPRAERQDANDFVTSVEDEMRAAGLNNRELAGVMMLHFWAYVTSRLKLIFDFVLTHSTSGLRETTQKLHSGPRPTWPTILQYWQKSSLKSSLL